MQTKQQDLIIRMEQIINFSALNKFLHQTLIFTEEVKNVLQSNCNEAIFCLKPWHKEIITKQDISNNACICSKSENGIEEIAAGISRALLQTQQLREKISLKVTKEEKFFKQPTISEIYNPRAIDDEEIKTLQNLRVSNNKLHSIEKKNTIKNNEKTKNDNKQSITNKKELTRNTNFLVRNKCNIKNTKEIKKLKNTNHKLENNSKLSSSIKKVKGMEFDNRSTSTSTNELKNLIHKVSSESNNYTFSNADSAMCPLHGNIASQVKYEQSFITMDVVDSLNAFNIPGEIIKSLKTYHTYLNIEFSEKSVGNGKRQKMLNIFLIEFNKMDKIVQDKLIEKTHDASLLTKFISLLKNLFIEEITISNLVNIKKVYTELNCMWKMYDAKKSIDLHIWKSNIQEVLFYNNFDISEWMSNGIWNFVYTNNFEGMSRVQCICYKNKKQLLLFFEMIQQLQQIQYFKDLIKILSEDLLPSMIMFFDFTKPEYVKIYKMICILHQGLNPKVPILVRTDV
ncbi:uncharacterized protein LOC143351747 [Colletes latitarsis]|uniref:uncharacterized protein LOC143351747 n=1 Tax=Colletes latitarsis TaxID=2605962 RepID=UPI0040353FC6